VTDISEVLERLVAAIDALPVEEFTFNGATDVSGATMRERAANLVRAELGASDSPDRSGFKRGQMRERRANEAPVPAPRFGGWDDPATEKQKDFIEHLLDYKVVPEDLVARVSDAYGRGMLKADATSLIMLLMRCPQAHQQRLQYPAAQYMSRDEQTEEEIERQKQFDYSMAMANGEEYPGALEERFGAQWLERQRNSGRY
jgi:hypothetical protein